MNKNIIGVEKKFKQCHTAPTSNILKPELEVDDNLYRLWI